MGEERYGECTYSSRHSRTGQRGKQNRGHFGALVTAAIHAGSVLVCSRSAA